MTPLLAIPSAPTASLAPAKPAAPKPVDPALKRVCDQFEASFVKQLLEAAKIGGEDGERGYGQMAVDALAGGIEAGGGLGLSRSLERALSRQHEAEAAPPAKVTPGQHG